MYDKIHIDCCIWTTVYNVSYIKDPQRTQMPYHSIYVDWIKLKLKENNIFTFHPATHVVCCVKLRLWLDRRKSNELNNLKNPNQTLDFCLNAHRLLLLVDLHVKVAHRNTRKMSFLLRTLCPQKRLREWLVHASQFVEIAMCILYMMHDINPNALLTSISSCTPTHTSHTHK